MFRVSGGRARGRELGMGHIYRCLNLAERFAEHDLYFLMENFGGIEDLRLEKKYHVITLMQGIDAKSDINQTVAAIRNNSIDMLIIDKHGMPISYYAEIKKHCMTVAIGDLTNIQFPADLVVNGFVGFENSVTKNKYGDRCLLGPKYQILNKRFGKNTTRNKRHRLLVTLGGFDEYGLSEYVARKLGELGHSFKTKIILGPASTTKPAKQDHAIIISKFTNDMQKEIGMTEFGLCSGGLTSYEFASQGIPFAIICQERHQLKTAKEWEKRGLAINLGLVRKNLDAALAKYLACVSLGEVNLRTDRTVCDGLGGYRVAREILSLSSNFAGQKQHI